jgi:hypothetical protein
MSRKLYKKIHGKYQWIEIDETVKEETVPAVHTDTLKEPLKHPVTGKIFESRSAYEKETKRLGLEVVGNDKLSEKPRQLKDKITESQIMDAIHHAEAIHSDPAKLRAQRAENKRRLELINKLLYGKR